MSDAAPRFTLSPAAFRRVALAAVWALALTVLSGAAVRLTGSGLGCPDWPACTRTSVVAPMHLHAWVEFANRLVNALVSVASIGALAAAVRRRPRRADLTWLSAALVGGLVAEIVLGALVVYSHLDPVLVSVHFLLGLAFLTVAVVLHERSKVPDGDVRRHPVVAGPVVAAGRLVVVGVAAAAALGTVVTSTGPHGGDPTAPRFALSLHSVAQLHGTVVETLMAVTLLTLWLMVRHGAPRPVVGRTYLLVGAMAAQAAVGYTQYLNGDPVALVGVHVAGAAVVVAAAVRFHFGLYTPVPVAVGPGVVAAGVPAGVGAEA